MPGMPFEVVTQPGELSSSVLADRYDSDNSKPAAATAA
eukprot:SAG22_NODE_1284_length_4885_cov_2.253448_6_plen_37_part_01